MEMTMKRFVRPEHLNHHESLYAGRLAEWVVEAAMIRVSEFLGENEGVVLAAVKELQIFKPILAGTILSMETEITHLGTTSIVVSVQVRDTLSDEIHATGSSVFVTVDENGKKRAHGLR